ncbi:MAG: PaaI family thioesterase [Chloroflexi bacterium]|nr:PaaI family thioesterase [Chloroflexota bacterium]
MDSTTEIQTLLAGQPQPVCAQLTPFRVLFADGDAGIVRVEFSPQPAFENHFGNIQGGFSVAMMDVVVSLAAFVKTRQWIPTVEIKTSFVTPMPIAPAVGEGQVLRSGRSVTFVEGKLFAADGTLAVHATATLMAAKT